MNIKVVSMIIISVGMFGQIWSSSALSYKDKEQQDAKLWELRRYYNLSIAVDRIHGLEQALRDNDYHVAFYILHQFSSLYKNPSECREMEHKISIKEASLSLLLTDVSIEDKSKILKYQEQLQAIRTFVQREKENAKEIDTRNREDEKILKDVRNQSQNCVIQ